MGKIILDGTGLTVKKVNKVINHKFVVEISDEAIKKVKKCQEAVDKIVDSNKTVYGINTGFGEFSSVVIEKDKLRELQKNLICSHSVGCGTKILPKIAKTMMLLRINALLGGHSGIRVETIQRMLYFLNNDIIPVIYSKGSVGSSGDLVPLAHMVLPIIGEGEAIYKGKICSSYKIHKMENINPIVLSPKEGLALINGTQYMSANAVNSLLDIARLINISNIVASMSLEGYMGTLVPFDKRLHQLRPHLGQTIISEHIRKLLSGSEILENHRNCKRVQDPYSLRCIPQVHGASFDTYKYVKSVVETEINSVTDNPIVFPDTCEALSGGNFHGQPLALVLDFIAMAVSELGSISERRGELLLRAPQGTELPMFLIQEGGVNSGLMIAQYAAASLVNHNKVLCHPASVDSIPTSADKEDHVSMGATSAIKLREIIDNVYRILSIEMLISSQAIEFHRPLKTSDKLEKIYSIIREKVPFITKDRMLKTDVDSIEEMIRNDNFEEFYFNKIQ